MRQVGKVGKVNKHLCFVAQRSHSFVSCHVPKQGYQNQIQPRVGRGLGLRSSTAVARPADLKVTSGVRIEDSGSLHGRFLVTTKSLEAGESVFQDKTIWALRRPRYTADGRLQMSRIEYQQLIDDFFQLNDHTRKRVLELFCPSGKFSPLGVHFGTSGEQIQELLRIPDSGSIDEAWQALRIFSCNALEGAIYPMYSCMNHSCAPNVFATPLIGGGVDVSALCSIAEGDQICTSYLDAEELARSRLWRQIKLLRGWGFVCKCVRCQNELASNS